MATSSAQLTELGFFKEKSFKKPVREGGPWGRQSRKKKSERDSKCFKTQLRSMQDQGALWGHPLVSSLHSMWGNPESFHSRPGSLRFSLPPRATPTQSPSHIVSRPSQLDNKFLPGLRQKRHHCPYPRCQGLERRSLLPQSPKWQEAEVRVNQAV